MALFQRISMLLSIIIFALATRQIIVNGITIDSFSDVCGRSAVPLYCNFSGWNNLQPLDTLGCGSSFLMSRNIDANDIGQAAGRLMECCAASQASALTHFLKSLVLQTQMRMLEKHMDIVLVRALELKSKLVSTMTFYIKS